MVSRSDQQPGAGPGPSRGPRNAQAKPWRRALAGKGLWAMHGAWATCKPGRLEEHKKGQPPERSQLPMIGALDQNFDLSFCKNMGSHLLVSPTMGTHPKWGTPSKRSKTICFTLFLTWHQFLVPTCRFPNRGSRRDSRGL